MVDVEKRRYPIVALLLSLLAPGLGQVYNGRPVRGLIFLAAWPLILVICGLLGAGYSVRGFGMVGLALIGWLAVVAVDAVLQAKRLRQISLRWYNRWYAYACLVLVVGFVGHSAEFSRLQYRVLGIRAFKVPAATMDPTLKVGDHFIAAVAPYKNEKPRRGDLVVFPYPEDRSKTFVKRVIGLGGEKLEIRNKQIFIDGKPIEEPYKQRGDPKVLSRDLAPRDNFGPVTIQEGSVFVMGDNRDFSHDSRFFGPVRIADVEAKALYMLWAKDMSRIGIALK